MGPSSSKLTVHPIILYVINPGYKCLQYVKWYNEHVALTVDTVDIESNTGNFISFTGNTQSEHFAMFCGSHEIFVANDCKEYCTNI